MAMKATIYSMPDSGRMDKEMSPIQISFMVMSVPIGSTATTDPINCTASLATMPCLGWTVTTQSKVVMEAMRSMAALDRTGLLAAGERTQSTPGATRSVAA